MNVGITQIKLMNVRYHQNKVMSVKIVTQKKCRCRCHQKKCGKCRCHLDKVWVQVSTWIQSIRCHLNECGCRVSHLQIKKVDRCKQNTLSHPGWRLVRCHTDRCAVGVAWMSVRCHPNKINEHECARVRSVVWVSPEWVWVSPEWSASVGVAWIKLAGVGVTYLN